MAKDKRQQNNVCLQYYYIYSHILMCQRAGDTANQWHSQSIQQICMAYATAWQTASHPGS